MISQPIVERIGKVRAMLQRGDYVALLDNVSSRVMPAGNPVLYWDRFVIVGLSPTHARPPRRRGDQVPVPATPEDIEAICRQRPDRRELIERRVREGQRCFVIREGDQLVARQWLIGDQPLYGTNSGLSFAPPTRPAAWCHDIFVDPAHRMRGHFVALMMNALRMGPPDRPPHLYGEIHFLNLGSIRAHLSFGYRVIRTVTLVSVLGLKMYRIEDDEGRFTIETRHAWRVRHI